MEAVSHRSPVIGQVGARALGVDRLSARPGRPSTLTEMVPRLPAGLMAELTEVVGPGHLLTDPEITASYVTDWTGRFTGTTPAVVRPATTAEVAGVVGAVRRHGLAVTVQGGNTGLVGGGIPPGGEIVLSLTRLDGLGPVDEAAGQVTAGAGVTVADLVRRAGTAGWAYGVDLASRDSATVGGTVATNAGGLRVLRYGDTRAQLLGVEAVLGTGAVVSHLAGLLKDNTGYHLASLLCGSEGTLGVVTAARLRLVPPTPQRVVALLAFGSAGRRGGRRGGPAPGGGRAGGGRALLGPRAGAGPAGPGPGRPVPDRAPGLPAGRGGLDPGPHGRAGARPSSRSVAVADVAVATDSVRAAELWRYREAHTEAINTEGAPHKLDVTLPAGALAEFVERVPAVVAAVAPAARCWLFGHAADGNVHVNVTGVDPDDERVDGAVLELVAASGAASAPSTGSARPSGAGSRSTGARPRSTPFGPSSGRSIPTACSTPASCCPIRPEHARPRCPGDLRSTGVTGAREPPGTGHGGGEGLGPVPVVPEPAEARGGRGQQHHAVGLGPRRRLGHGGVEVGAVDDRAPGGGVGHRTADAGAVVGQGQDHGRDDPAGDGPTQRAVVDAPVVAPDHQGDPPVRGRRRGRPASGARWSTGCRRRSPPRRPVHRLEPVGQRHEAPGRPGQRLVVVGPLDAEGPEGLSGEEGVAPVVGARQAQLVQPPLVGPGPGVVVDPDDPGAEQTPPGHERLAGGVGHGERRRPGCDVAESLSAK